MKQAIPEGEKRKRLSKKDLKNARESKKQPPQQQHQKNKPGDLEKKKQKNQKHTNLEKHKKPHKIQAGGKGGHQT